MFNEAEGEAYLETEEPTVEEINYKRRREKTKKEMVLKIFSLRLSNMKFQNKSWIVPIAVTIYIK